MVELFYKVSFGAFCSMVARRLLVGVLLAVLTACASTPSPRKQVLSGLAQKTRTIAIRIDEKLPSRDFQVHESQAGKGAGRGAAQGVLGSLAAGAQTRDPYGFALGRACRCWFQSSNL